MSFKEDITSELKASSATLVSNVATTVPFLSSALDHFKTSASNATSFLNPSPMDLLLLVPRMVLRAGTFALVTVPERIDSMVLRGMAGTVIASATGAEAQLAANMPVSSIHGTAAATIAAAGTEGVQGGGLSQAFAFQNIRNFGGVFTYLTSKWALGCFTVVRSQGSLTLQACTNLVYIGHHTQSNPGIRLLSTAHTFRLAFAVGIAHHTACHVHVSKHLTSSSNALPNITRLFFPSLRQTRQAFRTGFLR